MPSPQSPIEVPEEWADALCAALDEAGVQLPGFATARFALGKVAPLVSQRYQQQVEEAKEAARRQVAGREQEAREADEKLRRVEEERGEEKTKRSEIESKLESGYAFCHPEDDCEGHRAAFAAIERAEQAEKALKDYREALRLLVERLRNEVEGERVQLICGDIEALQASYGPIPQQPTFTLEEIEKALASKGAEELGRRIYERTLNDLPLVTPRWDEADPKIKQAFIYQAQGDLVHFLFPAAFQSTQKGADDAR